MIQKIIIVVSSLFFVISCSSSPKVGEDGKKDKPENIDSEISFGEVGPADDDPFFSDPDADDGAATEPAEQPATDVAQSEMNIPEPTAEGEPALDMPDDSSYSEDPVAEQQTEPEPEAVPEPAPKTPIITRKKASVGIADAMRKPGSDCNMRSGPGAGSQRVGMVKKGRKIWTENHNDGWFKVYRKKGHAFVSKNCF